MASHSSTKDCNYTNSDEIVRDRIVFATNSLRVRKKLLSQKPELMLEKAIDIARSHELSKVQLMTMANDSIEVFVIHRRPGKPDFTAGASRHNDSPKAHDKKCNKCGGHHSKSTEWPAKGKQCLKCQKFKHYAKVCKTKSHAPSKIVHREIHTVQKRDEEDDSELFVDTVTAENENE